MAIQIVAKPKPAQKAETVAVKRDRPGRPSQDKQLISLRLSKSVIAKFKTTGPGWQARINEALKRAQS